MNLSKRTTHAIVAATGLAIAAGALVVGGGWSSEPEPVGPPTTRTTGEPGPGCAFLASRRHAFAFGQSSRARINPMALLPGDHAGAQDSTELVTRETRGGFLWRVVSEEASETVSVAAIFDSFQAGEAQELPPGFEALRQTPVLIELNERCQFQSIAAPPDASEDVLRQWQLVLSLVEFIAPPAPDSASWTATQRDGVGSYLAAYQSEQKRGEVRRERKAYRDVTSPDDRELYARVIDSESRARWAGASSWIASTQGREEVEVSTREGRTFAHVQTTFELRARPSLPESPFWTRPIAKERYREQPFGQSLWSRRQDYRAQAMPGLSDTSTAEALRLFEERLQGASRMREGLDLMIAYLRLSPEHPSEVLEALRSGTIDESHRAVLFLALREAGGKAARDVLIEAASHPALQPADRLRALAALARLAEPDEGVVDAIEQVWKRGRAEDVEARSAMLAMGALSGHEALSDELRGRIDATLRANLDPAATSVRRRLAMEAVGNAGAAGVQFTPEVSALLDDRDPGLRAAAHETLRRLEVSVPHQDLLQSLSREDHPRVEAQIRRRLLDDQTPPSPVAIDLASRMLATQPSAATRRTLIEYLGRHAGSDPLARYALIEHFPREPSRELVRLVGQFVDASEL